LNHPLLLYFLIYVVGYSLLLPFGSAKGVISLVVTPSVSVFLFFFLSLCKLFPISVHLQQIVSNTVEQPLRIHLPLPSQCESIQSQDRPYMDKGRLCSSESSVINESALYRVYLLSHLFGESFRYARHLPLNKAHLAHFACFRMP
jgi:hypothetical protein